MVLLTVGFVPADTRRLHVRSATSGRVNRSKSTRRLCLNCGSVSQPPIPNRRHVGVRRLGPLFDPHFRCISLFASLDSSSPTSSPRHERRAELPMAGPVRRITPDIAQILYLAGSGPGTYLHLVSPSTSKTLGIYNTLRNARRAYGNIAFKSMHLVTRMVPLAAFPSEWHPAWHGARSLPILREDQNYRIPFGASMYHYFQSILTFCRDVVLLCPDGGSLYPPLQLARGAELVGAISLQMGVANSLTREVLASYLIRKHYAF
ncbi:unnamed protein product [Rhizoctonia solani]|uniref:Uncharacterized protein n=1 Tax=Rhizoctonia solani TaxID=456999 RepID=A0A8H3BV18_9AGAM|nr:unnamed protein product [Rhizoctonia solani]